jgi:hypothetical protein
MWHKHDRRKMLAEAEEKVEYQSVLCEICTEVEETVELQTVVYELRTEVEETAELQAVVCEVSTEAEHQSVMSEVISQPEETVQHQSLLQKSPMKQYLMIQTKCILCGAQAGAEETIDHGAYNTTQRNEMVETSLLCSKIKKRT